jgi:hypothetical protein
MLVQESTDKEIIRAIGAQVREPFVFLMTLNYE